MATSYAPPVVPGRWRSTRAAAVAHQGEETIAVELLDQHGIRDLGLSLVGDLEGCRYGDVTVELDRAEAERLRDALTAWLDRT